MVKSCLKEFDQALKIASSANYERMPIIVHKSDYGLWLDKDARKHEPLKGLLQPYFAGALM